MKIKKFTGKSLKDVTELMRSELGDNAIILHTKSTPLDDKNIEFQFEITAAIDDEASFKFKETKKSRIVENVSDNPFNDLMQLTETFEKNKDQKNQSSEPNEKHMNGIHEIRSDLDSVKGTLGEIAQQLKSEKIPSLPRNLQTAYHKLIDKEIDPNISNDIIQHVFNRLSADQLEDMELIDDMIITKIADHIRTSEPFKVNQKQSKLIVFAGPTGVGKTTTIYKISAICKFLNHYNVAIISTDTYRIGSIDQLKTFTNIANIPFEVAYSPNELDTLVDKHSDKDIILIDTVGRNPRNRNEIEEILRFINAISPDEVHLVISATTSYNNMEKVLKNFGTLMPNRLVFTKIDESLTLGPVFNILYNSKIPLSYITNGQNTPDDILIAESIKMANTIYHGYAK
jgi:flagellar biosynthesis protein FlhF